MKLNMNSQQTRMILYAIIAFLVWKCWSSRTTSGFTMKDITITPASECNLYDLPYTMDCVPGSMPTSSNYTMGLSPGGICGAQKCVADQANYTITGGIGVDEPAPAPVVVAAGDIIST